MNTISHLGLDVYAHTFSQAAGYHLHAGIEKIIEKVAGKSPSEQLRRQIYHLLKQPKFDDFFNEFFGFDDNRIQRNPKLNKNKALIGLELYALGGSVSLMSDPNHLKSAGSFLTQSVPVYALILAPV
ncbi:MAG: hypothetical protein QM752_01720 [Gammaproteobacteria bacterium]